jgi:hypothetical protein
MSLNGEAGEENLKAIVSTAIMPTIACKFIFFFLG